MKTIQTQQQQGSNALTRMAVYEELLGMFLNGVIGEAYLRKRVPEIRDDYPVEGWDKNHPLIVK
jgi:hypothetical protein